MIAHCNHLIVQDGCLLVHCYTTCFFFTVQPPVASPNWRLAEPAVRNVIFRRPAAPIGVHLRNAWFVVCTAAALVIHPWLVSCINVVHICVHLCPCICAHLCAFVSLRKGRCERVLQQLLNVRPTLKLLWIADGVCSCWRCVCYHAQGEPTSCIGI